MRDAAHVDPAVHRRRLRRELRNAREAAGKTQRDVAVAMDWSPSKLIRIESGAVNVSTNDLRALLSYYEVDAERIHSLVDIARAAREATRWRIYRDVASPEFLAFLGYESSASTIRTFEPLFVPGLLQTEEYARSVISTLEADSPWRVDSLVDLRMERQELLVRDSAPDLRFIMDEAVIRRVVGNPKVMQRQLRHLQGFLEDPHVAIHVVPFSRGMYPRQQFAYWIFEFVDIDDHVLYVEDPHSADNIRNIALQVEDKGSPVDYLAIFYELEKIANLEDTSKLLEDAIAQLAKVPSYGLPAGKASGADFQKS